MRIEKSEEIVFVLKLNAREAELLRALVQNPLCDPDDESEEYRELRRNIFEGLNPDIRLPRVQPKDFGLQTENSGLDDLEIEEP